MKDWHELEELAEQDAMLFMVQRLVLAAERWRRDAGPAGDRFVLDLADACDRLASEILAIALAESPANENRTTAAAGACGCGHAHG